MNVVDKLVFDNIIRLMKKQNKKQKELTDYLGVTKNVFTDWKSGRLKSYQKYLPKIADFFGVSVDYLLGLSVPDIDTTDIPDESETGIRTIPVLGEVAAGIPIDMVTDIEDYEQISTDEFPANGEYYALKIKGDSMEPVIPDGSTVIFRRQDYVDNGSIAIVCVNGFEATCKKVIRRKDGILLKSLNPTIESLFFSNSDIETEPITIIGKVIEVRKRFV